MLNKKPNVLKLRKQKLKKSKDELKLEKQRKEGVGATVHPPYLPPSHFSTTNTNPSHPSTHPPTSEEEFRPSHLKIHVSGSQNSLVTEKVAHRFSYTRASNVSHHCCHYDIIFEVAHLNLQHLYYFAMIKRPDCKRILTGMYFDIFRKTWSLGSYPSLRGTPF